MQGGGGLDAGDGGVCATVGQRDDVDPHVLGASVSRDGARLAGRLQPVAQEHELPAGRRVRERERERALEVRLRPFERSAGTRRQKPVVRRGQLGSAGELDGAAVRAAARRTVQPQPGSLGALS